MEKNSPTLVEKRTLLFVSYSRKDKLNVDALHEALSQDDELEVYLDTHDIEPGVDWKARLEDFIRSADSILFVVSPNSASSEVCQWEMELAELLNKRIVPVVAKDIENEVIPKTVSKLNYIFCRKKSEFEPALASIKQALKIDVDWIKEHTRIADRAYRWEQTRDLGAQPLRGRELEAAEQWLASQPKEAPAPTEGQRRYIYESRKTATKRQRIFATCSIAAVMIFGMLAAFSLVQWNAAIEGERKAQRALAIATQAANTMVFDLAEEFEDSSVPAEIVEKILDGASKLQQRLLLNASVTEELELSRVVAQIKLANLRLDLMDKGHEQALNVLREAVEISRRRANETAEFKNSWLTRASVASIDLFDHFVENQNLNEAKKYLDVAISIRKQLFIENPNSELHLRYWSVALERRGNLLRAQSRRTEAITAYEESLKLSRKIVALNPSVENRSDVAHSLDKLDIILNLPEEREKRRELSFESLKIRKSLFEDFPNNKSVIFQNAVIHSRISRIYGEIGDLDRSLHHAREFYRFSSDVVAIDPNNIRYLASLATAQHVLAGKLDEAGETSEAIFTQETSIATFKTLLRLQPKNEKFQKTYKSLRINYLQTLLRDEQYKKANQYIKIIEDDKIQVGKWDLAQVHMIMGDSFLRQKRSDEAKYFIAKAAKFYGAFEQLANREAQKQLAAAKDRLGDLALNAGELERAIKLFLESKLIRESLLEMAPKDNFVRHGLASSLMWMGDALRRAKEYEVAFVVLLDSLKIRDELVALDGNNLRWRLGQIWTLGEVIKLHEFSILKNSDSSRFKARYVASLFVGNTGFPENKEIERRLQYSLENVPERMMHYYSYRFLFEGAAKLSERFAIGKLKMNPIDMKARAVLAHALMLQGRTLEAENIYIENKGAAFSDKISWMEAILDDFNELRKNGISHQLMNGIKSEFEK